MKVLLTTKRCKPPYTHTIECDKVRYFKSSHKYSFYKNDKLIAYAFIDDWEEVSYIDDKGEQHFVKKEA